MHLTRQRRAGGFTLIEVLVTIALMLIGIVGILTLQSRASGVELESYQRGQALSLARDMAARIADSRNLISTGSGYLDGTISSTDGSVYVGVLGNGTTDLGTCTSPVSTSTALQVATYEVCAWAKVLQGAAEGTRAGSMLGARGCIIRNTPPPNALGDMYVVVVWKGITPGTQPLGTLSGETATPASECASAVNFGSGLRRGLSVRVLVPYLQ